MNFGFNTNVSVGHATYHVQTEDRGPSHPFLDTVVYLAGRVIYKRSTPYDRLGAGADEKALAQKLREHLSQQHREVIAELEAGTLPIHGKEAEHPAAEAAEAQSAFNLRLVNPKNWFDAGQVTLEIELSDAVSKKVIGEADVQACLEHERQRIPCAEVRTDSRGCAVLKFAMPENVVDGTSLVVRATDGSRFGQLRFTLKAKSSEKTPAPVS
ncbi:MAG TPA: hypothetical protein VH161_01755 [Candidatus Acidoferrales bacterium]|jgi:hypothetical protein|nr:hypothetical protein [Candidatus Acidoferrales bacterium]